METISVRKLDHSNLHVDCDYGIAAELKEFFSFFVPGYRFMPAFKRRVWDGKIRLYDANSGELPAGLYPQLKVFVDTRGYNLKNLCALYCCTPSQITTYPCSMQKTRQKGKLTS